MRVAALEALKSPLSGYESSAALREKVQGAMVNGSPSGDNVFGQSSPAAKADEIYSSSNKITTGLSSRSTQAHSPAFTQSYYV
jgi:hypothetical protein